MHTEVILTFVHLSSLYKPGRIENKGLRFAIRTSASRIRSSIANRTDLYFVSNLCKDTSRCGFPQHFRTCYSTLTRFSAAGSLVLPLWGPACYVRTGRNSANFPESATSSAGRAIAQAVSRTVFPPRRPGSNPG
jgi:hypothetical protein